MTKTTCIYHKADFDGLFCREIARKFLPADTEFIGWDYGDPEPAKHLSGHEHLYIMDLSIDSLMSHPNLIWIDHHKTAIEKYPNSIRGYRIDGVAACRLAWQWFTVPQPTETCHIGNVPWLPEMDAFIQRKVSEPYAVRLAGEYDIWDKRDPNAELFQHGLRSCDLSKIWDLLLLDNFPNSVVDSMLRAGTGIQYAKTQENEGIIKAFGFTVQFEGFCLLACNAARYNSQLFTAGLKPEHDGMLGFNWDGKQWRVSLYSDKPDIDLSVVAKKYGGGGHRGACGFRVDVLPFMFPV